MNIEYGKLLRPVAYILILMGTILVVRGYYEHKLEAYSAFIESKKEEVEVEPTEEDSSSPSLAKYIRPVRREGPPGRSPPSSD